jgi:hypothetical protein
MPDALLTVDEVARRLDRRPREVFALIAAGVLIARTHGDTTVVTSESVDWTLAHDAHCYGFAWLRREMESELPDRPGPDPLDELEREGFRLRVPDDGIELSASLVRQGQPGTQLVAAADHAGRVQLLIPDPESRPITDHVALLCDLGLPGESIFIVSDRTGEEPADRPDDELDWECARGVADVAGIHLLDWWITWETLVFSAAEFAPSGPGWPVGTLADVDLPKVQPRPRRICPPV